VASPIAVKPELAANLWMDRQQQRQRRRAVGIVRRYDFSPLPRRPRLRVRHRRVFYPVGQGFIFGCHLPQRGAVFLVGKMGGHPTAFCGQFAQVSRISMHINHAK
jgi:hypothetical protein